MQLACPTDRWLTGLQIAFHTQRVIGNPVRQQVAGPYSLLFVLGSEPARVAQPIPRSAATQAGGCGTRARKLISRDRQAYPAIYPTTRRFATNMPDPIVATINVDFRAKRRALIRQRTTQDDVPGGLV